MEKANLKGFVKDKMEKNYDWDNDTTNEEANLDVNIEIADQLRRIADYFEELNVNSKGS